MMRLGQTSKGFGHYNEWVYEGSREYEEVIDAIRNSEDSEEDVKKCIDKITELVEEGSNEYKKALMSIERERKQEVSEKEEAEMEIKKLKSKLDFGSFTESDIEVVRFALDYVHKEGDITLMRGGKLKMLENLEKLENLMTKLDIDFISELDN